MDRIIDREMRAPRGAPFRLAVREGTSDLATAFSTCWVWDDPPNDEYRLAEYNLGDGTALDVGAHIGSVTLALLADNPQARVIAVEPIPENAAMVRRSLNANGWAHRADVIEGAASKSPTVTIRYGFSGSELAETHRYIGNIGGSKAMPHSTVRARRVTLASLVRQAGGSVPLLKIDAEGGEWAMLAEDAVRHVAVIVGEYHGAPGAAGIRELLAETHEVDFWRADGACGTFRAVRL